MIQIGHKITLGSVCLCRMRALLDFRNLHLNSVILHLHIKHFQHQNRFYEYDLMLARRMNGDDGE